MSVKRIGVITSGGDAPGMNAAVRAVVRTAIDMGLEVYGVIRGYNGLLEKDVFEMNVRSVSEIIHRGGTMLYTARCLDFKTSEGVDRAVANCKEMGIDGLVVIGGDGSFRGAKDLSERGIPCIGVPATIDNDISCSDYTIGFDTALNTAVEMIDRLRDTMQSHDRCSVVEVMGRHAGHLAMNVGLATGATYILVPEETYSIEKIVAKINRAKESGKHHFILVVAEGVEGKETLAKEIEARTGIETKRTVLGHVQRGGNPTARDRILASEMGYEAVQLLSRGIGNRVICYKNNGIIDMDIFAALAMTKTIDRERYKISGSISI